MSRAPILHPNAEPQPAILDRRNPGAPLDLGWLRDVRVSRQKVERSAGPSVSSGVAARGEHQAALLLRVVTCIDLTVTLRSDARSALRAACAAARHPISPDTLLALGAEHMPLQVASLCVPCDHIAEAARSLQLSGIPVAGCAPVDSSCDSRLDEIATCAADGAEEIEFAPPADPARRAGWHGLYAEIASARAACGPVQLKANVGAIPDVRPGSLYRAALVCSMAGADFVSIPWSAVSAATVASALAAYYRRTGARVGLKLSSGVRTAHAALQSLAIVRDALGPEWLRPSLFRIAADESLAGVGRQLDHYAHAAAVRPARRAA